MIPYYLRIEAINLGNFVYDTPDLSTVRGGGLLLLGAVEKFTVPTKSGQSRTLTTGASVGLYEFEAPDSEEADSVCDAVRNILASDPELQHATFAASVQPNGGNQTFAHDMAALQAKNRWQQMQSPSLALSSAKATQVCEIDLVRPATRKVPAPENQSYAVSESVAARRLAGQRLKQKFYQEHIGRSLQRNFTHELQELTADKAKGNLNEKMAVIYLDGNKFGTIKKSVSHSSKEWLKFDQIVKSYRRDVLEGLLDRMEVDGDWQTREGKYRIETLLWGGDELMWIVPAWKGWETLQYFYEQSQNWHFNDLPLRHSAGLVFCHHNAPIHRITALARGLAELAKANDGREHNRFAYEILESFDHVGRDLEKYRSERCPQSLSSTASVNSQVLILEGESMSALGHFVYSHADEIPRKQLHEVTGELLTTLRVSDDPAERQKKRATLLARIEKAVINAGTKQDELKNLQDSFNGAEAFWLHVNALWDYLV